MAEQIGTELTKAYAERRRPLPGISDVERLEDLKDSLYYATNDLSDAAMNLESARLEYDHAHKKHAKAQKDYMQWLEMMAAGVSAK